MIVTGKVSKNQLSAIDFFADMLLSQQLKKHIILHVTFRKKMDCLGLIEVEDYNSAGKPRAFTLDINRNQSSDEIIHTLAHEMVHLSQYSYGKLNEEATSWCGKQYARNLRYSKQPWEIEAHDVGDLIFYDYKNRQKKC